jgi:post-segregation antitoxin (ccd killing protein)
MMARTEQADELEAVARAEGISVSDAVREAIAEHIAQTQGQGIP